LTRFSKTNPATYDGLSILVYVHGWKHNADADDDDVKGFRKALKPIALVEKARVEIAKQSGNLGALRVAPWESTLDGAVRLWCGS